MKINLDQKNDVMRIKFQDGRYDTSEEVGDGIVIDMTKEKKIIAIEIIDVSRKIPKKNLKEVIVGIS